MLLQIAPLLRFIFPSCCVFVSMKLSNYQRVFVFLTCETRQSGSGMFLVSPHIKSIQCICLFFSFLHLFWDFETQQEQEWNVPPYQNHPNAPRLDVPPSHRVPQIQHLFCCTRIPLKIQNIQTLESLLGNSYWSLFSKVRPGKSKMSASESSVNVCKHHCSHIQSQKKRKLSG